MIKDKDVLDIKILRIRMLTRSLPMTRILVILFFAVRHDDYTRHAKFHSNAYNFFVLKDNLLLQRPHYSFFDGASLQIKSLIQ